MERERQTSNNLPLVGRARRRFSSILDLNLSTVVVAATVVWLATMQPLCSAQAACQRAAGLNQPLCGCQATITGIEVSCSNRSPRLTSIPSELPDDTTVLNVANNNIMVVRKEHLVKLEKLRTLFLQQNMISRIESGAFDALYSLELLVLNQNQLSYVRDSWFQHLPSLRRIDLSNNMIITIDKRAFLTLPSSKQSQVTIELSGNKLVCDCRARALRAWRRGLAAPLAPITFNGYQCVNYNGRELDGLQDNELPSCTSSQLAILASRQMCFSCRGSNTQHNCDTSRASVLCSTESMCQSHVQITNSKLTISKTCGSYADCLLRARDNYHSCNVSHSSPVNSMQCTFCCTGQTCNQEDMGGRTKSYRLYVGLRVSLNFQDYMLDQQDPQYIQQAGIYTQKLNEIFQGVQGGFDVMFLSFRNEAPNVYVSSLVYVTTLNVYAVDAVVNLMVEALNSSAQQGFLLQKGTTHIYVGTELATARRCVKEVTHTTVGDITWREASIGSTVFIACPSSTSLSGKAYAQRACVKGSNGVAQWQSPDVSACEQSSTTGSLTELNNTNITPGNVNSVLTQLKQLTSDEYELTPTDVTLAVDTVDKALAQGDVLNDPTAMDSTLQVISNLMDAETQVLAEADRIKKSAGRMLAAADKIAAEGKMPGNGQMLLSAPNLVVAAVAVDADSFRGLSLTANTATDGVFKDGDVQIQPKTITPTTSFSSLVLPPSLLNSAPGSRIALKALASDKVFDAILKAKSNIVSDAKDEVRKVNSYVMDATVVGRDVTNLPDPVNITYVHLNENATNPACVFWDVGRLQWSSEGCSLVPEFSSGPTSMCQCNHLTNFALLMDVYGEGTSLSELDSKILSIISYIGCGVSLLGLFLTLLTYVLFKKLRRDNPSKILVNLCIALALSNLIFVAGMHPYALNNTVGCKIVAVLLHFSLLSALCWMAVEAFYMYLALVLVFKTYYTNFLLKCSLIGWGVPLLTIAITLGVNETDNYGSLNTGVCWLKGLAFYIAFVAPVGLILIINFVAFGLVLRQILGLADRKLNKSDSFTVSQQLRGAVGVAILLGLTWVFAVFAIGKASIVFYYLFAIFNSLQGLWIFVFYCVLKKEARNAWKRALPCFQTLDDRSMATTRAGYSATQVKGGRSKSSTDNGATTTTTVFTSKQDSEADNNSEYEPIEKTAKTPAVESNQVYINLGSTADQSNRTAYSATTNPTYNSQAAPAPRPIHIRQDPSPPSSPTKPRSQEMNGNTRGNTEDQHASPRPLHFKLGHAYSLDNSTQNNIQQSQVDQNVTTDSSRSSVADIIKRLEKTRM